AVVQRFRDALEAVPVAGAQLGRTTAEHADLVAHVLDIATGGERRARAGEDGHPDLRVGLRASDHRLPRLDRLRLGDRIARGRIVQRPHHLRAVAFDEYGISHSPAPGWFRFTVGITPG